MISTAVSPFDWHTLRSCRAPACGTQGVIASREGAGGSDWEQVSRSTTLGSAQCVRDGGEARGASPVWSKRRRSDTRRSRHRQNPLYWTSPPSARTIAESSAWRASRQRWSFRLLGCASFVGLCLTTWTTSRTRSEGRSASRSVCRRGRRVDFARELGTSGRFRRVVLGSGG